MSATNSSAVAAAKPAGPPEERLDRRRQLLWSGMLQSASGPCPCTVVDISSGGAKLSTAATVKVGQAVTLLVSGIGMFRGTVVWTEGGSVGIAFTDEPRAA